MALLLLVLALAQAAPVDLLVTGGTIVTVDRDMRVLEGGSVAVRGERIEAVIPAGQPLPPARETVDARSRIIMPGLVNAHTHAPMVLLRGAADDMKLMQWLNEVIFPEHEPVYDVYSHLVYVIKGASVRTVLVGGRIVLRDGELPTVNEREVLSRCRDTQRQILSTLGRPPGAAAAGAADRMPR